MNDGQKHTDSAPPEMIAVAVNKTMILLAVLTVTVISFFASFYPKPIIFTAMSNFLMVCASGAATLAFIRGQRLVANYLTFWDLGAVWLFLAIGAGILSDSEAIESYRAATSGAVTADPGHIPRSDKFSPL